MVAKKHCSQKSNKVNMLEFQAKKEPVFSMVLYCCAAVCTHASILDSQFHAISLLLYHNRRTGGQHRQ